MVRNKLGQFVKNELNVKIRGNVAYVSIWNKNNLFKSMFDKNDLDKLKEVGALVLRRGYVCCKYNQGDGKRVFKQITRIIMDCPDGMVVDHINGNKLDNRKENLRIVTQLENSSNRNFLNRNNKSGENGITIQKYGASVVVNGKRIHLGTFDSIEEAVQAVESTSGRKIRPANKQSKTGYRGIYPIKHKAWIGLNGERKYLGSFETIDEAKKEIKKLKSKEPSV